MVVWVALFRSGHCEVANWQKMLSQSSSISQEGCHNLAITRILLVKSIKASLVVIETMDFRNPIKERVNFYSLTREMSDTTIWINSLACWLIDRYIPLSPHGCILVEPASFVKEHVSTKDIQTWGPGQSLGSRRFHRNRFLLFVVGPAFC